jgi:hypothetical protein
MVHLTILVRRKGLCHRLLIRHIVKITRNEYYNLSTIYYESSMF